MSNNKKTDYREGFEAYFEAQKGVRSQSSGNFLYLYLDNIDQKTGALLTHVSIMLAVSAILFGEVTDGTVLEFIAGFEVVGYMIVTIGCLTCINIMSPSKETIMSTDLKESLLSTVRYRLYIYKACLHSTIILTIVLVAVFLVHLLP